MSNQQIIDALTELMKEYSLPWRYRVALSWCVGKLFKEMDKDEIQAT